MNDPTRNAPSQTLPAWLLGAGRAFDVVFMDPPFAEDAARPVAAALVEHGWLAPGALVYVESRLPYAALGLPADWRLLRSNRAGQVRYHLARAASGQGGSGDEPA